MKKVTLIILLFALNIFAGVNIRVDYPQFVKKGDKFSLSFVSNFNEIDFDTLRLSLSFSSSVKIDSVKIQDFENSVNIKSVNGKKMNYLFEFTPDKFSNLSLNQIIVFFNGFNLDYLEVTTDFYFMKNGYEEYRISSDKFSTSDQFIDIAPFTFYEVQNSASNSLRLKESELTIELPGDEKTLFEFWMKSGSTDGFDLISDQNEVLTFLKNKMGFADFINHEIINFINDYFTGCNWNHFIILKNEEKLEIYINGEIFADISNYDFNTSQLAFSYKDIEIDNLRIWKFGDEIESVKRYIHHNYSRLPNSTLMAFYQFDKEIYSNNFIHVRNANLVKSTAPIFSTRPELDVKVYDGYYLLNWKVFENEEINLFEIERKADKGNFETVAKVEPNSNSEYSFVDNKLPESDLVYYRVKQVLKDGIVNYSNEIKIGQNQKSLFILAQNFPNPFNPVTKFQVEMLKGADVSITVFNVVGNKIRTIYKGFLAEGIHQFDFDGSELPSGIYFYEIKSNDFVEVKKMILTK